MKSPYIIDNKYRIKNDAWEKFLQLCDSRGERINKTNPGPRQVLYAPNHSPFHEYIMLEFPFYWFHESELELVEE